MIIGGETKEVKKILSLSETISSNVSSFLLRLD
jgi:hypothetical protein